MLTMSFLDSGLCYVIKYGDEMRAWIDVGFSTAENHWEQRIFYANEECRPMSWIGVSKLLT